MSTTCQYRESTQTFKSLCMLYEFSRKFSDDSKEERWVVFDEENEVEIVKCYIDKRKWKEIKEMWLWMSLVYLY